MIKEILSRLQGKNVIITGGKRVGQYVAQGVAECGANIILPYRNSKTEAEETVAIVREKYSVRAMSIQMDAADRNSVVRAAEVITRDFPSIYGLVNMASVFSRVKFEDMREEHLKDDLDAHFFGTIWPSQVFSAYMPVGGHIVNISDRTVLGHTYVDLFDYTATKGSVPAITRSLAAELAKKGIHVNDLAPGPIVKPPHTSDEAWRKNRERSPVKDPIDDEEAMKQFAFAVVFLLLGKMTNSSTLSLDGGLNIIPEEEE